tara:strand:+ start:2986 stop:3627 length:642 start_codon:yes stop_codon:yes gene_type:complete
MQAPSLKIIYKTPETPYEAVTELQETIVAKVVALEECDTLIFCEHAPIYTCGTSTQLKKDYIGGNNVPVIKTGRGGRITYHGPGQRVIYPVIDLRNRNKDLRQYICDLQQWLILSLADIGVEAYCTDDVGVWVKTPSGEKKIAAIGVRVRKWVAFHGIALNVSPDMNHFTGIVPCGIKSKGVTSLKELGINITMQEMDEILLRHFKLKFHQHN